MKSSVRRVLAGIAAAGLLSACSGTGPGVAADVDGHHITDRQVDDFAEVLCSLGAVEATQGGTPTSRVRAQSLQILLTVAITQQMTDESGVDQDRVRSIEDQMNQSRSGIPEGQQDTFDSVVAQFARAQSAIIDLGRKALRDQGKTGPIDDQTAYDEGNKIRTQYAAKADIEVDPRFGTMVDGVLEPGSGSLSVPVSQGARDAEAATPVGEHVDLLPASQKCS